jgi:hypothetical protein
MDNRPYTPATRTFATTPTLTNEKEFDGTKLRIEGCRPKTTTGGINSSFCMKVTFHISAESDESGASF